MDDPGWSWSFWKFGLKKDDLFGKLHDQYNTLQLSLQDPEAFHHDVFEISSTASSSEEFHRLLADRKQLRLRELNDSLESASLQIIANPSLIGTEQWQFALQLFRTKSFDSLVRYFASYLPDNNSKHKSYDDSSSDPETASSVDSIANSHTSGFFDPDDGPIMTDEPLSLETFTSYLPKSHLPSPWSMTMCSDESAASPADEYHHHHFHDHPSPARALSFSEPESESCESQITESHRDDKSHSSGVITPVSELSDSGSFEILETVAAKARLEEEEEEYMGGSQSQVDEETFATKLSSELESDTPTPRLEQSGIKFFDSKPSPSHRRHRSALPPHLHSSSHSHSRHFQTHLHHDILRAAVLPRRRRDASPVMGRWRSPGEPTTRIQKPLPEPTRSRPRICRRFEG